MTPDPGLAGADPVRGLDGAFRGFVGAVIGRDTGTDRLKIAAPVGRRTVVAVDRRHVAGIA